jgi:protein O-mannosyl-transferase
MIHLEVTLARRDFNAPERLMTQVVILWEYLYRTLIPTVRDIGFFHDDYQPIRTFLRADVIAATLGWLGLSVAAVVWRRKWPLLGLAVFWYLGAHFIESTTVPLELYFEHRNYVPLMGVFIALGIGVVRLPYEKARTAALALGLFFLMQLLISLLATTLWADNERASEFWLETKPESERAVTYFVRQRAREDDAGGAVMAFEQAKHRIDSDLFFTLSQIWLKCHYEELAEFPVEFSQVSEMVPGARFNQGTLGVITDLPDLIEEPECDHISQEDVLELTLRLLDSERFGIIPRARYALNRVAANLLYDMDRRDESIGHYETALAHRINVPILHRLTSLYIEMEDFSHGCEYLERLTEQAPRNPVVRTRWTAEIRTQLNILGNASPEGDCDYVSPGA